MLVKSVKCRRFAGLKDKEVAFAPGLNVLLGPNEAGKSTLVGALHAALVQDAKLDKRRHADFLAQYTPRPSGDLFDAAVQLELDGQALQVEKEWGRHPRAQLELPNGDQVSDELKIRELLREHLQVGEGSISSLVVARQSELRDAISRVLSDAGTKTELGSLLRQSVMELDGVAVEDLQAQLTGQIGGLLNRWDWERQRPEGGRGIDNPWKSGLGEIVKCYYQREQLRRDMTFSQRLEDHLHQLSDRLKQNAASRSAAGAELEGLVAIDEDINRRAALEPQLTLQNQREADLKQVSKEWPRVELQVEMKREELVQLGVALQQLDEELRLAEQLQQKQAIDQQIKQAESLQVQVNGLQDRLAARPLITKEDILRLQQLRSQQAQWEATLQGGRMQVDLQKLTAADGWLVKGLGERELVQESMQFAADGYLRLEIPELLVLQVKALEIDIDQVKREYDAAVAAYRDLLERLAVKSTEEAREVKQQQDDHRAALQRRQQELAVLLGGRQLDQLVTASQSLVATGTAREVELIKREMQQRQLDRVREQGKLEGLEQQVSGWTGKYGSSDDLLLQLVQVKGQQVEIGQQLAGLAALPAGVDSVDQFKQRIKTLREDGKRLAEEAEDLKDEYRNQQAELPEDSYEELAAGFQDAELRFGKLIKRATGLLRVQQVLEQQLAAMASHPFDALAQSFTRYLSEFTAGNYRVGDINEQFELSICRADGLALPVEILSAGTYDGVALALRFAMLEHLFQGKSGMVVLDDCLVDLDPQRKAQAARTIQAFAQQHQVIFTTCDPGTAALLGGNRIEM